MDEIQQLECRTGPLTADERWTLRFGSRAAYERARAKAHIRYLTRRCMAALDSEVFRTLRIEQDSWRATLRALA